MSAFIQRQFKVRGSDDTLSDRDSGALATKAVMLLSSGAFMLQWVGLVLCRFLLLTDGWCVVCPRSYFPVADIRAARRSLHKLAGTAARGWCHCTRSLHRCGVVLLCISRGRLHTCSVMHRVTCNLCWFAVACSRLLCWRACDVLGLEQGAEQELPLVCLVVLVSSMRALFSPAVLRVSDQACIAALSPPIEKLLPVRVCVVTGCMDVVVCNHDAALVGGLLGSDTSRKLILASALMAVQDLTYEELRARYTLEVGQVWTGGHMRIMIRDHYPALFRSMCKSANVHTIGDDTAWKIRSFTGGHALLRGTAGTGKSAFMFVMFIEFLKMLRAPPTEEVVEVDGVVVFSPTVASIRIQWDGVYGGESIVFGQGEESLNIRRRVHLFDAGADAPVRVLPGGQGEGYFLATSSLNPIHYSRWDCKQVGLKRQYNVLWSVEELRQLNEHLGDTVKISPQQLYDRYTVVGGVPRLIFNYSASQLLTAVRNRVTSIAEDMVRMVTRNDVGKWEARLRTCREPDSFSMFAMDVKAEGDFDDVRVSHQARLVKCGSMILSAGPGHTCRSSSSRQQSKPSILRNMQPRRRRGWRPSSLPGSVTPA